MSNTIEEHGYSDQLFDNLFEKIKGDLKEFCEAKNFNFKGLWAFAYLEGANSLNSIYFNHENLADIENNHKSILQEIRETSLDCDYGSLGFSFSNKLRNGESVVDFLLNTYSDAKGTVCYYDIVIKQKHAYFVIIKNKIETLGVLDFFFDGILDPGNNDEILKFFENKFDIHINSESSCDYQRDFVNAFKIREFEVFLKLQNENANETDETELSHELTNATAYIEKILAASSRTPLMIIKHKNGNYLHELVSLNFDFIHSIIQHEHRFCPISEQKDCFHFKDYDSFQSAPLQCHNYFLTKYYYEVFKALNAQKRLIDFSVNSVTYTVDAVCIEDVNYEYIKDVNFDFIENEIKNENLAGIAEQKYRDERVYLEIDKILNKKKVCAFSLSRQAISHLKFSSKCADIHNQKSDCTTRNECLSDYKDIKNVKQFISPSTILPVLHREKNHDLFDRRNEESKTIVHFKIINEQVYIETLKALITTNPEGYMNALNPYLSVSKSEILTCNKNLSTNYVGENPLKDNKYSEVIKGKLNLIEALLQEEEIKYQARKAAISQVFARTGSHNLGSHVLAKMITSDAVSRYFDWNDSEKSYSPIDNLTDVNQESATANFNSYMRDRMDFLADLSTATPLMEVSKSLMADVISGMDRNRILMNFISGVSKFDYTLQIRNCRTGETANCTSPCLPIKVENGVNNDIQVSMPNDVMGFHALYIIIENVIRNTAKHGGADGRVDFTLEVRPCKVDNTLYEVCIYDSCSKENELTVSEKQEYKEITGKDSQASNKKIDLIVARQNQNINKAILDSKANELRHGAWGIIEMEVAAAYLRKIPVETVDEAEYKVDLIETNKFNTEYQGKNIPNIIKAVNKNGCLGYIFHLMKPKELLVVDEVGTLYKQLNTKEVSATKSKLEQLKEQGIWVTNHDKNSPDVFNDNDVYPHPFMIIIPKDGFEKKMYLKANNLYKGNLPTRILVQGTKPIDIEDNRWIAWTEEISFINKENDVTDSVELIEKVWKIWMQHRMSFLKIESLGSIEKNSLMPKLVFANAFNTKVLGGQKVSQPNFNFCIDHHGSEICNAFDTLKRCFFDHYEAHPSAVNNFLEKAKNEKIANSQLIEGILTNIVIIDERIQAIYKEKYYPEKNQDIKKDKECKEFDNNEIRMKAANIHIPAIKDIDLNQSSFEPNDEDNLHAAVGVILSQSSLKKGIDLIVIHLGVIERILEAANKSKGKPEVLEFIQNLTSKFNARVVITSGRGKPDNLPQEVPFLTYSALSHYAIETPFKTFLNQALQSSRIFNKT